MSLLALTNPGQTTATGPLSLGGTRARLIMAGVIILAIAAGLSFPDAQAAAEAGPDLTRLLRLMAVLKACLAAGAVATLAWRLGTPVPAPRYAAYAVSSAAMTAGPGLIWGMGHVALGAVLLHGGLLAVVVLLWRDPGTAARLQDALHRRGSRSWRKKRKEGLSR